MAPKRCRCKECGTEYPLEARYVCEQCFGPLEVAYDSQRARRRRRRSARSRPARRNLALRRLPAVRPGAAARAARAGADAAGARRPARRAARPRRGVDQERRRQSDPLVQGPRRRGRAGQGARARLRRRSPAPRPATSRTPSPRTPPPPGSSSYVFVPADLEEQKLLATGVYGTRLVGVQRQLRRRQPALHRARRDAAVGVRQRQPAPLLRRGLEDARLRDRRAARLDASRPVVCPIASGSLFTKIGRGLTEWLELGLIEGELPTFNGAQASGCNPVAEAFAAGPRRLQAAAPGHDRQEPRDRQSRRRPLRARSRAPHRRLGRGRHRRRDPRRHPAARRDDRDLHRDRRRRHDRDAGEARRARRDRAPTSGRRGHHRRGPEDARRDPRRVRDSEIEPITPTSRASRRVERVSEPSLEPIRVSRLMAVTVKIPAQLRAGDRTARARSRSTGPRSARRSTRSSPARRPARADHRGRRLRRFVNVYVSGEDIRFQDGLETPLSDGDEVTILPAVAGGAAEPGERPLAGARRRPWRSSAAAAAPACRSTPIRSRRRWSRSAAGRSSGT